MEPQDELPGHSPAMIAKINQPPIMRLVCRLMISIFVMGLSCGHSQSAVFGNPSDGVVYEVIAQPVYSDPEEVTFEWSIVNKSSTAIVVPLGMQRIKLIGPDGKTVSPYPYHVSGRNTSSFGIDCYPPGGRHDRSMRLSSSFPFPQPGEYRCILTQRIYQWHSPDIPENKKLYDDDYFGVPKDLTAPELRFRVEAASSPERLKPRTISDKNAVQNAEEFNGMGTATFPPMGERRLWGAPSHPNLIQRWLPFLSPKPTNQPTGIIPPKKTTAGKCHGV